MLLRGLFCLALSGPFLAAPADEPANLWFHPAHRLTGIGADRRGMSDLLLAARTSRMIESLTFTIMRDPRAVAGAERVTSPGLQKLFRKAAERSGLPASLIEAVAYLESWGDPRAESPGGPRGIMQIAEGTARGMGLRISYARRHKVTRQRVLVHRKGRKPVWRTVRRKTYYSVRVRDDRLSPARAVPAAAMYLARLEQKFGGRDWAVFAYHCGEGCATGMQALTARAEGLRTPPTVAQMFFLANPAYNRELYQAVSRQMERDYSPTYWFRIMRAQQLLQLWREDPNGFRRLAESYRSQLTEAARAPHRLAVWIRDSDLAYKSCQELVNDNSGRLAEALDDPSFFGYRLLASGSDGIGALDPSRRRLYLRATPAALGTLLYIAFETRRLYEAMHPDGESWTPLPVSALVEPMDYFTRAAVGAPPESLSHCTGQVFDLKTAGLPRGEAEALRFVLDDMGWDNYLGFIEESAGRIHVGCAPEARDFFTGIYEQAVSARARQEEPVSEGTSY